VNTRQPELGLIGNQFILFGFLGPESEIIPCGLLLERPGYFTSYQNYNQKDMRRQVNKDAKILLVL
jgi:hypothetical protein